MIGARFGHFRLEQKLGQGGMGVVYRARDEKLQRMVALKLLPTEWATDPTARARLLREARAAASLTHRNVATVYEVGEEADQIFLAMEMIEGRSLRTAMLEGGFSSLKEKLRIVAGIVRGVAKAHEKGIVHRDLKPENVMLSEDGEVKVLDFGLARQADRLDPVGATRPAVEVVTKTGQILGTPAYMSPEQATGQPLDAPSDVFSLGIIIYELTTGRHPFSGDGALAMAVAIVRDEPAPASSINPEVTPGLDRIVATCLAKAPSDRYSTARDLLRDLERLTEESPSSPVISSVSQTAPRRSRAVVIGLAATLVAIGGVSLWFHRSARDARANRQPATASGDRTPPRSSNPEATRLYLEGLHAEQEGRTRAAGVPYKRALELDPTLAPALLRLALGGRASNGLVTDEARAYFRRALEHRTALDERDNVWLDAWEPVMQREPADQAETIRRLRAALVRFPNDTEISDDLVDLICNSPDIPPEARAGEAKAAGLAPKSLAEVTVCANKDLGSHDEVLTDQESCERTPSDVRCLNARAGRLAGEGRCAESEAVARRLLTIEPGGRAEMFLATALLGQRGQEESVKEILRKWTTDPDHPGDTKRRLWGEITVAMSEGDFTTAIERIHSLDDMVKDLRAEKEHAWPAQLLAGIFEEIGRPRDAANVARSFLARRAAYEPNPGRNSIALGQDPTGLLLGIERRAGTLSPEQHRGQLRARLDWWDHRLGATSWLRYYVWQAQYAEAAETPAEANDALAALPRFGHAYAGDLTSLGRTHLLGGMVDEALPELEKAAKRCPFIFGDSLQQTRSWYFLGEARAAKGDRQGACAAYGELLERWGAAKPRSLTAGKARRRRNELRCSS